MDQEPLSQWLALYALPGLPLSLFSRLMREYDSPVAILETKAAALRERGVHPELISCIDNRIAECRSLPPVAKALSWGAMAGNHIISLRDADYPPLLKEITDPPPILFVKGRPERLLIPQLAIVGSRHCSVDGREVASWFATDLALKGFSICSGLARGIDTAAHSAASSAGAITVGVLGCGVDRIYPSSNLKLAQDICKNGALVSELPLGSAARAEHFPRRNRIISGMSLGVIVIEAAEKSGSLITARMAMEQGREVFAVPGSARNPLSKGCHRLIRDGATLVDSPEQVLEQVRALVEFQLEALHFPGAEKRDVCRSRIEGVSDKEEREVLRQIGYDPVTVDLLMERLTMELPALQATLLALEFSGKVRCVAGRYCLG